MSCEGSEFFINCDDCTTKEPDVATLKCRISLSQNGTLVHIWEGKIEDSILVDSKRVFSSIVFEKRVPLNRHYTITATYIIDNKTYVAVNSATPKIGRAESKCDETCYYVYGNEVELRLKYKN
jgi:hypothetical protein